jgi:hypothetical protein
MVHNFMRNTNDILLSVWQEISRHLDIGESIESAVPLLRRQMPLAVLSIRRLDDEHRTIRTVAAWPASSRENADAEVELSRADFRRLQRWVQEGAVLQKSADGKGSRGIAALLRYAEGEEDYLVAALKGEHGSHGVARSLVANTCR